MGRRSTSDGPQQLEKLWKELTGATPHRPAQPALSGRRGERKPAGKPGRKRPQFLLLLPGELLIDIVDRIPQSQHLRLAHVCRHLRQVLCAGDATGWFWASVCACHWGGSAVGASPDHAVHCQQIKTVVENAKMLCSPAMRAALNVHYTSAPSVYGSRGPPQLQVCDSNSGSPAVYNTRTPLGLCLLMDSAGAILGFAIFATVRFYVNDPERNGAGTQDIRNYVVVKRGQRVTGSHVPTSGRQREAWRFRVCREHSALTQGIQAGEVGTAVVAREALVQLDPRKHSVAYTLPTQDHTLLWP